VLRKLKHSGKMSGTHNKLYHGKNFNHWKFWNLGVDLSHFSFSNPNPNFNPTRLPKTEFLSPNNQFYQLIFYVEYQSVYEDMAWSQKFRKSAISLDTGKKTAQWFVDFGMYFSGYRSCILNVA